MILRIFPVIPLFQTLYASMADISPKISPLTPEKPWMNKISTLWTLKRWESEPKNGDKIKYLVVVSDFWNFARNSPVSGHSCLNVQHYLSKNLTSYSRKTQYNQILTLPYARSRTSIIFSTTNGSAPPITLHLLNILSTTNGYTSPIPMVVRRQFQYAWSRTSNY